MSSTRDPLHAADESPRSTPRAPWRAPELVALGALPELTRKVDNAGKNDGGSFPKRRT